MSSVMKSELFPALISPIRTSTMHGMQCCLTCQNIGYTSLKMQKNIIEHFYLAIPTQYIILNTLNTSWPNMDMHPFQCFSKNNTSHTKLSLGSQTLKPFN